MIPGDHSSGPAELSPDCFDPEAPDDPATCFAHDEKDFESNETVWALYERWCSFHSAEHDHDDMVRWFGCFKDRARRIIEFNKSSKPYKWGVGAWGLNIFDDMTPEELFEFGNN
uniref:Cathepsin propeptide inhibitor domain-containing protein n=2 Tax=Oryza TaxID=4527 RepID=A0A0E0RFZ2_ORYRU